MSQSNEFIVTYFSPLEIEGKLLLYPKKLIFKPDEEYAEQFEIKLPQINDVRFTTKKEISALRVFLFGVVAGALWKKENRMLTVDFEDEFGMVQSAIFRGEGMDIAMDEIYNLRRKAVIGESAELEPPVSVIKKELKDGTWRCSRCSRINSANSKFCTRCGEWKE
jgi:hypothetical protein